MTVLRLDVFCILLLVVGVKGGGNHHISERSLLFPQYTVLQFTYGLTVPYILPSRSINLSLCLQVNYDLPYNLTNFMPTVISARDSVAYFDIDRRTFYSYIISILDEIGFDGESCLLRLICDISNTPMHIESKNSLLENIVHFIFTPSLDLPRETAFISNNMSLSFIDKLLMAEDLGRSNINCGKTYSACEVPLVDLFTAKYIVF